MLIKCLFWRILMGVLRWAFSVSTVAKFEPLLSIVIVSGLPFYSIDFSKQRCSAALSRWARIRKSTV